MTLERVPRYGCSPSSESGEHAIVVGGSMGGLVAARVLADHFESVTVLDRDPFPSAPVPRDGAPQTNHPHALLEAGRATLADLFTGFSEDLLSAGGLLLGGGSEFSFYTEDGFLAETPMRTTLYSASRPLIEHLVRERLRERDAITLRGETPVTGYVFEDDADAVTGVEAQSGAGGDRTFEAELVVDASGRTSRTPGWLADAGYPEPRTESVEIDVAYTTIRVERPPGDRRAFFASPEAPRTHGAVVLPIEDNRWEVMLQGVHGDTPPTDPDAIIEFAERIPVDDVAEILDAHDWVEDVHAYPFPSSRRVHYEAVERFPDGLVVTGDALASFNPVYGQGMSAAALDALILHHCLADGGTTDLASRYFDRASTVVDDIWSIAVGGDFAFEATTGPKPTGTDLFNRYLSRLLRRAHTDGVLTDAFYRVLRLERPPTSLLHPRIAVRVLRPRR